MNRAQVIRDALENLYGDSRFEVMHGSLSTVPILKVGNDANEIEYIVPEVQTVQQKNEDFKISFSFGVMGKILTSASEIKFSLFAKMKQEGSQKRIFSSLIPVDFTDQAVTAFNLMGEVTDLNFELDTIISLRIEAIFTDSDLINMINENLSEEEKPVDNSVTFSALAAKMLVIVEED
ncbi:hypothetical protein [Exiguobacterium sp. USCH10]|jgi:hypothetical protein|uniref:hypothetical protein n=1 Tax=Exiguobacterium sp. USCH10 TaxID=3024839 RepID=UPI0030AC37AA